MKKITLLTFLLVTTFTFSQSFPLDFEDVEDDAWTGFDITSVAVVTDPTDSGNMVLELVGSGIFYDGAIMELDTYIDLSDDANNTITFEFWSASDEERTHLLKFEGGPAGAQVELEFNSNVTGWQTINVDFGPGLSAEYTKIVFFPDFASEQTGTYYVDDVDGPNGEVIPGEEFPSVAAPVPPARDPAEVVSIFSGAYENISVNTFDTDWCPASTTEIEIDGNATKQVVNLGCEGVDFQSGRFDATGFSTFHIDFFTFSDTEDQSFNVKFSNWNGGNGEANAIEYSITNANFLTAPNPGTWYSVDIPLDDFTAITNADRNDLVQFVITSSLGTVFYDNLYMHNNTTLNNTQFTAVDFKVFPNPTTNVWTLNSSKEVAQVQVFDVLGKSVMTLSPNAKNVELDASTLNKGIYFATIQTSNGSESVKLIKN
ncbi:T9SS type A sorting domain-containing protein [Sediminibacter sp. Hel_I_10]|uniref:T9SS type A sorting domain-containing protein n=1 Tax=Sediminibacter sp. Hel_I_10 TaxID=1392490 RepID=UPI00068A4277|nr:T9SS type A sorting domain-containing protein [Sediminibacter sp. Hel_I_10]